MRPRGPRSFVAARLASRRGVWPGYPPVVLPTEQHACLGPGSLKMFPGRCSCGLWVGRGSGVEPGGARDCQCGAQGAEQPHGALTAGTGRGRWLGSVRGWGWRPVAPVMPLWQLDAQALGFGGRMTEAVVTDRAQAPRAARGGVTRARTRRPGRWRFSVRLPCCPVLPAERDGVSVTLTMRASLMAVRAT